MEKTNVLKKIFIELLSNYTNDSGFINELWSEIERNYSDKKRRYHTLQHLENLLTELKEVKHEIQKWDVVLFSLYYHDIVYNTRTSGNEEKSAELAEKRMQQIGIPKDIIESCKDQILATKSHFKSTDGDTNYFTDADLSILGQAWEIYSLYSKNIREEYATYPDFLYNSGRKKVLDHFLSMECIFKTNYFYNKFEIQAKKNIQLELDLLNV